MRRVIVVCVLIFTFTGIAWAALALTQSDPAPPSADQQLAAAPETTPSPPAAPWNGAGTQDLNATFLVSGNQIVIRKFSFGGLNKRLATVDATVLVIPAGGHGWLTKAFRMNNARATFAPKRVKVTDTGKGYVVSLRFTGIPAKQLRGQTGFSVTYPTADISGRAGQASFSVSPYAPKPPADPAASPAAG